MVWISNFTGPLLLLCARSSWHPRPALVKDILALRLWSLWSQQAADCPAGTQEEGTQLPHTHTHAKHTQLRDNYTHTHTQSRASQRLLGQQIQPHEPPTLSKARAQLMEGAPEGNVSGGWTRVWKREPGKLWSSATHPASSWVPGKRAKKQVWTNLLDLARCTALTLSQKTVHFHVQTQSSRVLVVMKRQNVSDLTRSPHPEGLFKLEYLQKSSFICSKHTPSCYFQITRSLHETGETQLHIFYSISHSF